MEDEGDRKGGAGFVTAARECSTNGSARCQMQLPAIRFSFFFVLVFDCEENHPTFTSSTNP